jgi:hypothetical protein
MKKYAVVKDSLVTNIIIFADDVTDDLLEQIKTDQGADQLVLADGHPAAAIEGTWDGNIFMTKDGQVNEDWDLSDIPEPMLVELRTILN